MNYLLLRMKRFCGFITGFVFLIGGILKLMDPVGAGLVMKDYLEFLHIGFFTPASKVLGVLFASAETIIGAALITGVWRKFMGISAIAFQIFFTILTLLLVIFNPEMDCGCFGEAIHLTHWQTFIKNIILLALLAAYYFPAKRLGSPKKRKYFSFALVTISAAIFGIYSWIYIPMVDFTDYKVASALKAGHSFESTGERYEALFIYEKDGVQETFDLDHLPDSTWTFVSTETVEVKNSGDNRLIDLSFCDSEGQYHDELATTGRVLVISIYNPDISKRKENRINKLMSDASRAGIKPILLIAGTPDAKWGDDAFYADYKTLIALNRSNGGATYFNEGYLIQKWASVEIPDFSTLTELAHRDDTETIIEQSTEGSLGFQGFLLYMFAILLLI